MCDYSSDLRQGEWGLTVILRSNNPQNRMSALGQKRTYAVHQPMSALPPKATLNATKADGMSAAVSMLFRQMTNIGTQWVPRCLPTFAEKTPGFIQKCRLKPKAVAGPGVRLGDNGHVCFTSKSGHVRCTGPCLLWAKSGHRSFQFIRRKGAGFEAGAIS